MDPWGPLSPTPSSAADLCRKQITAAIGIETTEPSWRTSSSRAEQVTKGSNTPSLGMEGWVTLSSKCCEHHGLPVGFLNYHWLLTKAAIKKSTWHTQTCEKTTTNQPQTASIDAVNVGKLSDAKGWKSISRQSFAALWPPMLLSTWKQCLQHATAMKHSKTKVLCIRKPTEELTKQHCSANQHALQASKLPPGPQDTHKALQDKCDRWKWLP